MLHSAKSEPPSITQEAIIRDPDIQTEFRVPFSPENTDILPAQVPAPSEVLDLDLEKTVVLPPGNLDKTVVLSPENLDKTIVLNDTKHSKEDIPMMNNIEHTYSPEQKKKSPGSNQENEGK